MQTLCVNKMEITLYKQDAIPWLESHSQCGGVTDLITLLKSKARI